jgi:ABC-type phosphate/phosphonate transport system substrate-binding protein
MTTDRKKPMKTFLSISVVAASTLVLSGCSFSLPSEADQAPCEALSAVFTDKLESLPTGGFDVQALVSEVEADVISSAPDDFKELLEKMKVALTSDPIAAGDLTTAATQIGVRCALVGVNVEFPNVEDLLAN